MSRQMRSRSSLFLTEILIDILLFMLLCACGLMFFMKSTRLTKDSTDLHQGVRLCSQIASVYESGDGTFSTLKEEYPNLINNGGECILYIDDNYNPCNEEDASSYIRIEKNKYSLDVIDIEYYNATEELKYSISTCCYSPSTLAEGKEDVHE